MPHNGLKVFFYSPNKLLHATAITHLQQLPHSLFPHVTVQWLSSSSSRGGYPKLQHTTCMVTSALYQQYVPPFTYQWPMTHLKTPSFPLLFKYLQICFLSSLLQILGNRSPHPSACHGKRCQRRRRGEEELRCVSSPCISGPLWRHRWAATCTGWLSRRRGRNRSRSGRKIHPVLICVDTKIFWHIFCRICFYYIHFLLYAWLDVSFYCPSIDVKNTGTYNLHDSTQ